MFARYTLAFVLAFWMCTFLFAIMIALIKTSEVPVADKNNYNMVDVIRVKKDPHLNIEDIKPEPPPQPSKPPPPAAVAMESMESAANAIFAVPEPNLDADFTFQPGFSVGEGDGEYLPIYRVPPQYPSQALRDRVEGWVIVEFTIGTRGEVKNARVVKANPQGVFDSAALAAVKRFRFKARTLAGTPIEVKGVQNRIRFRLK